jgi:hypothetical protein
MTKSAVERVQSAIRDCIERCKSDDEPMACIAEFVSSFRSDPDWTESEISHVQLSATRVIARLHREEE